MNVKDTLEAALGAFHEVWNQIVEFKQKLILACSTLAQYLDMKVEDVVSDDGTRVGQVEHDSSTFSGQIVLYDELLTKVGVIHRDYPLRSAHYFSFDLHVEDLMRHEYGLALRLYHLFWDGGMPSWKDGTRGCKYLT